MHRPHLAAAFVLSAWSVACRAEAAKPLLVPAPSSPLKVQAGNLAAGDVNADGRDDLLVPSERSLHVLLADAKASFASAPGSPVAINDGASELATGDVNGDRKLDVITASHDSYAVTVLLGDGSGTFASAPGSPLIARQPGKRPHTHGLALADFNGDKKLDVMTANQEDDDVALLLGDGRGGFAPAPGSPFACGPKPYPFAVADFNGDGNLDTLVPNTGADTLALLRGDGRGGFAPLESMRAAANRPFFVAAGDITGDGKPDAIAAHDDATILTILLNDGRGRLAPAPTSPMNLGSNAWKIAIRDLNGDGKPDLLIAAKDAIRALLGDGTGQFIPAPGSPYAAGKGTWRLAIGDFNGDGKSDVAATCVEEGKVAVMLRTPN